MSRPVAAPSAAAARGYRDAGARLGRAILRNRKATIGLGLLVVITFVALFPGLIAARRSPGRDLRAAARSVR